MPDYETAQIKVKVLMTFDPVRVSHLNEKHLNEKKDVILADDSGSIKLTLWNRHQSMNAISSKISKYGLCSANNKGIIYAHIEDIGDVDNNLSTYQFGTIAKAQIIGVNNTVKFIKCVK